MLEDHFRKSDVVIRLGGDEFVIFAHGVADRDIVQKKLRDINKDLVALGRKRDWSIPVTTSMGVVISQRSGNTFQRLYALADEKFYDAKEAGKDCHMLVEDREDGVIISPISEMSRACPRDTRGQGVSDDA